MINEHIQEEEVKQTDELPDSNERYILNPLEL